MSAIQLLIQRVTNGIIVGPVAQGAGSLDLSQLAVFPNFSDDPTRGPELLRYLRSKLTEPAAQVLDGTPTSKDASDGTGPALVDG